MEFQSGLKQIKTKISLDFLREVDKVGFIMSEEVNKTIEAENRHILDALHNDEAIYVYAYYSLDDECERVYDIELIREEVEENIENLIELNRQKGLTK